MRLSKADRLFSLYIRTKAKWKCARCKKIYTPPTRALQCSHFFGRRMKSVRWDEDNCDALCHGCHRYWETEDREGYRDHMIKKLGKRGFDALTIKAKTEIPAKTDEKMVRIFCREQLKIMNSK